MYKEIRILLFFFCALAFADRDCLADEPTYAGKPLNFWLGIMEDLLPASQPPDVWKTLGTNTVLVLIKALEYYDDPSPWKYWNMPSAQRRQIPYSVRALTPGSRDFENIGMNAAIMLYYMGDEARPAIPALIKVMKADGSESLKNLRQMSVLRGRAADALGRVGQSNSAVSQALIDTLHDSDTNVVRHVRLALKQVDPKASEKLSEQKL